MKIFLTGATGYIGSAVAEALAAAHHTVVGLARSREADQKLRGRGYTPYLGDLKHPESLSQAVQSCDAVISTATTNDGRLDQEAVAHMLAQLKGTGKPFVYTSGVWILGDTGGKVADETWPVNPLPMVAWRVDAEKLVLSAAAANLRPVVIRPAIVYGRATGIPAMFIQSANESGAVRYAGNGENHWPMIHAEDLASLYLLAVENAAPGSLYHAADHSRFRVKQIAEAASFGADTDGRTQSWPLEEARKALGAFADALVLDQQVSAEKARRDLGWNPQRPSVLEDLRHGSYALPKASR